MLVHACPPRPGGPAIGDGTIFPREQIVLNSNNRDKIRMLNCALRRDIAGEACTACSECKQMFPGGGLRLAAGHQHVPVAISSDGVASGVRMSPHKSIEFFYDGFARLKLVQ